MSLLIISNKTLDMQFNARDPFLEYSSSGKLIVRRLEKPKHFRVFREIKPIEDNLSSSNNYIILNQTISNIPC